MARPERRAFRFRADPAPRPAEATWILPLPKGAVADAFEMTAGDKKLTSEVLDASQARSVYERIVARSRDPGLLEYLAAPETTARSRPPCRYRRISFVSSA